jgi:hypothetical protein
MRTRRHCLKQRRTELQVKCPRQDQTLAFASQPPSELTNVNGTLFFAYNGGL